MQQQVLILTKQQQILQAALGEPLEDYLRRRYVDDGLSLEQLADALAGATRSDPLVIGTLSRWLGQLGVTARRPGRPRSAA
jgi:hypothetical protein